MRALAGWAVLLLLSAGCMDYSQDGKNSLVRMDVVAPGEECAAGGLAVSSGLDENRDGKLSDSEITSTRYLCNGDDGLDGLTTLVATDVEPPGANCPAGGIVITAGLDQDRDGVLDAEEISATRYVCNGENGESRMSLVSVSDEPAGAHCTHGGAAIRSGTDANGDGLLQPEEVTDTKYVCNGAPGADGADGFSALVRQEDAGAGDCDFGGRLILSGLDLDGDGYLDDSEVLQTSAVCNGEPGAPGHASLFETTIETAGANCSAGGFRVATGLDTNDSGVLDPGEVTAVRYVCHGGGVVMRASNAAWGGVCPRGGVKIETGVDDNGNGVLDDPEVDQTQYVCNRFFTQIAAGYYHSCALVSDGTTRCWGDNSYGQLGDGTTIVRTAPVQVSGLTDAVGIAAGWYHTCARLVDGTAMCWGDNSWGQLGDGTSDQRRNPVPVLGLTQVIKISTGYLHTCALQADGIPRCWGFNTYGQLGDGTVNARLTPVQVFGMTNTIDISAGGLHSCASLAEGIAMCWGSNYFGQLGDNSISSSTLPVQVRALGNVVGVSSGYYHTCAHLTDGGARCWGRNNHGQLGNGTTNTEPAPVQVSGLMNIVDISAGYYHTCARQSGGVVWCWGRNTFGQLGDGTQTSRLLPQQVLGLGAAERLFAGGEHTCANDGIGVAMCWGYNGFGQLGDGTTTDRATPVPVVGGLAP